MQEFFLWRPLWRSMYEQHQRSSSTPRNPPSEVLYPCKTTLDRQRQKDNLVLILLWLYQWFFVIVYLDILFLLLLLFFLTFGLGPQSANAEEDMWNTNACKIFWLILSKRQCWFHSLQKNPLKRYFDHNAPKQIPEIVVSYSCVSRLAQRDLGWLLNPRLNLRFLKTLSTRFRIFAEKHKWHFRDTVSSHQFVFC